MSRHPIPQATRSKPSPRFALRPTAVAVHLLLAGMAIGGWVGAAQAQTAATASTRSYNIPAGPLNVVLTRFLGESGVLLSGSTELAQGKQSPGVQGKLTPDAALAALLAGTGLQAVADAQGRYVLRVAPVVTRSGEAQLAPVTVTADAERESAWGPVKGYVVKRSGTGTKTDTPIIEIPQTISVVPAEQIETLKAQNLNEVFVYTPGVLIANVSGPTTDMFTIRGFTSASGEILRDGLRFMVNTFDGRQEPYGLERVEVLKGASSILYGAVAPGGIVNTVTKRPTTDKIREINVEAGSFNRKQISSDFAGPLSDDGTWSYRLTALHRDSDSFVDHVSDDRTYFAPALKWQPNASTSLTLLANYQHERTAFLYGFPAEGTVLSNPNGRISRSRFTGEPGFDKFEVHQYALGYLFDHGINDGLRLRHSLRYFRSETDHPSVTPSTSYVDDSLTTVTRRATEREDQSKGVTTDTSLEYTWKSGIVTHQTLIGFDYTQQDHKTRRYRRTASNLDLFSPEYGIPLGPLTPQFAVHWRSERVGLYLQDHMKISDKWVVSLGGRYDRFRYKEGDLFADPTDWYIDGEKSRAFTGRAGLVYLAENGLAPFISFSQSFEPTSGTDRSGDRFKPTRGAQYEVGVRYQPKGSETLLSASIYELTQQDVLTTDPQEEDFQAQLGKVRSRGVELEARTNVGRHARVIAAYAYTDARTIESNPLTPEEEGQRSIHVPYNQFSLWGEYSFGAFGMPGLRAGAGVRYVDAMRSLIDVESPSYTLMDAMVSYTTGPWRLAVNVTNLTDKVYVSQCTFRCVYGEPRKLIGTVSYRW